MYIRVLGSAAGGGFPQWNCNCENCASIRAGSADVRPRSQSSVAVSADGDWWYLLNASADVRSQIGVSDFLWPPPKSRRGTSIAASSKCASVCLRPRHRDRAHPDRAQPVRFAHERFAARRFCATHLAWFS